MKKLYFLICIALVLSLSLTARAQMTMKNSVFGAGSSTIADSAKVLQGTIGQNFIGEASDNTRILAGGFWYQISEIVLTGIDDLPEVPGQFELRQNYPNPFNPATTIVFSLPKAIKVQLHIFDVLGRSVGTLVDEKMPAGRYEIQFETRSLPSGMYFYRIQAGQFIETRKMLLVR